MMNHSQGEAFPGDSSFEDGQISETHSEGGDNDYDCARSDGEFPEQESPGFTDRAHSTSLITHGKDAHNSKPTSFLSDACKTNILTILTQHKATKLKPITAASLASFYDQTFTSTIKMSMNLPPNSPNRWWDLLRVIPNVGVAVQPGEDVNHDKNIDVFLKNDDILRWNDLLKKKIPLYLVKQRILDILRKVASKSRPINPFELIEEYKKAHGESLTSIVASHVSIKFTKFIEQLPGVVMVRPKGSQPVFYLGEEGSKEAKQKAKKTKKIRDQTSSVAVPKEEVTNADSSGFIEPHFSPISSPVNEETGEDFFESTTSSNTDRAIASGVPNKQRKKIQNELYQRMQELNKNKSDALLKVQFRHFIEDNIDSISDEMIAKILIFSETPPGAEDTPSSTPSHHSGTTYIEDLVDVDLLVKRFKEIDDPFTNDVAFLCFNGLRKFGQEGHAHMFLNALFSRIARSLGEACDPVPPNTLVTVRDHEQPWDQTLQWLNVKTLREAFIRIRSFSQHAHFMEMINLLGKKVGETVQYVTKPELLDTREGKYDYVYRMQHIAFFPIPIYAEVIHSFRSYETYTREIAFALSAINAKANIPSVRESTGSILNVSDLKLISKGIIKLMNAAVQHSDGNTAKSSSESDKLLEPLFLICELIAEKLSLLHESNQSCTDESLVVYIIQGIKGHAVHHTCVRKLMSSLAKVMAAMTADHFHDERIIDTFLQFALISLPTFRLQYLEVEEFLFAFAKLLKIVFEKFVRPHYVKNGAVDSHSLEQYAKVLAKKAKKYSHFDPSQLRSAFTNLSGSSKAVRVFFLALRPWMNFSFCDYGFDSLEVLKTIPFDKIVNSYTGLCHLRDALIVEDLSSLFTSSADNPKASSTSSNDTSADVLEMLFNFDYIVEQTLRIPFSHCVVGQHFSDNNDSLSTDFLAQQSFLQDSSSIAFFSRQFNPRVRYMALKNIGRCCSHWQEDDPILEFVLQEIVNSLDVELEVAAETLPTITASKKRKRETHDHSPFLLLFGLYCELVCNVGRGKSWRSDAGLRLLNVSCKKLHGLMAVVQKDLIDTINSQNPQLDRKSYTLLKNLSLLARGIENVFQFHHSSQGAFKVLCSGALFYSVYVMDAVSKEAKLQSLSMLVMINRGLSRCPLHITFPGIGVSYDMSQVVAKQLSSLVLMMEDLENLSDINEKQNMQNTMIELVADFFQGRLFAKLMHEILDDPPITFAGNDVFAKFRTNFSTKYDSFISSIVKNRESFAYFFALSECFRSLGVFFTRIDLCDRFERTYLLDVVECMTRKLDYVARSFPALGRFTQEVQCLVDRQTVKTQADYQFIKNRLQTLKPDERDKPGNLLNETSDDGSSDGSEPVSKPWQNYGESALEILYNLRFLISLMTQVQHSSLCEDLICQEQYVCALKSVNSILAKALFLVLADLDRLSSKGLLRLLRVCLSILEFNASVPDTDGKHNVFFSHMGMLPHLIDDVFRRSVEFLQSKYIAHKQVGLNSVLKSNGSSTESTSLKNIQSTENPLVVLLAKDTLELFQECCFFVQYYFGTFPYSTTNNEENSPSIKEHYGSTLMALKEIYDNFYEGMIQLPGMFPATTAASSKLPNRARMDDVRVKLPSSMKVLENLLIDSMKTILFERNRAAWESLVSYCIVRSFPSLIRLEYSPTTILSVANRYVDKSFYERTENGLNCVTVYHSTFGRVMIFNSDLQMISSSGPSKSLKNATKKARENFHHHLLIDITTDTDFTGDTVLNLTLNSAKMSASFDVIYCLIILEIDSMPSHVHNAVSPAKAVEEMSKMTLHYLGLTI